MKLRYAKIWLPTGDTATNILITTPTALVSRLFNLNPIKPHIGIVTIPLIAQELGFVIDLISIRSSGLELDDERHPPFPYLP